MRICIDPGHSGPTEPGACAAGFTEAALTLSIAFQLGIPLAAKGHDVIYTRAGDIDSVHPQFLALFKNSEIASISLIPSDSTISKISLFWTLYSCTLAQR